MPRDACSSGTTQKWLEQVFCRCESAGIARIKTPGDLQASHPRTINLKQCVTVKNMECLAPNPASSKNHASCLPVGLTDRKQWPDPRPDTSGSTTRSR